MLPAGTSTEDGIVFQICTTGVGSSTPGHQSMMVPHLGDLRFQSFADPSGSSSSISSAEVGTAGIASVAGGAGGVTTDW